MKIIFIKNIFDNESNRPYKLSVFVEQYLSYVNCFVVL